MNNKYINRFWNINRYKLSVLVYYYFVNGVLFDR